MTKNLRPNREEMEVPGVHIMLKHVENPHPIQQDNFQHHFSLKISAEIADDLLIERFIFAN